MTTIRLFHMAIPGRLHARTFRCLWLLEELAVTPFEVCMVRPGEPYAPQMRAYGMESLTKLPAMLMDGREIGESGVICQLLAEHFRSRGNFLGHADERTDLLQWIGFAETCVMLRLPLMAALMGPAKDADTLRDDVIEPQRRVLEGNVERFEAHFRERESDYLLDSGFSIADMMCGWSLYTLENWGLIALDNATAPLTSAYLNRLRARRAFARTEAYAELTPGIHHR